MAEEKLRHVNYLRINFRNPVMEKGEYTLGPNLVLVHRKQAGNPRSFSEEMKDGVEDGNLEVSVLSIRYEAGAGGGQFLRPCAQKASGEEARQFSNELAKIEKDDTGPSSSSSTR